MLRRRDLARLPGVARFRGALRRLFPGSLILLYHRVADPESDPWSLCVSPRHFAEHLEVLRDQKVPVPLARHREGRAGPSSRRVALTFDDGYADNLHAAKPLLERFDVPATVFVVTGDLGGTFEFWWDELEGLLLQPGTLPETLRLEIDGAGREWTLGPDGRLGEDDWRRWRGWHAEEGGALSARHALFLDLYPILYGVAPEQREDLLAELRAWAGSEEQGRSSHRRLRPDEVVELAEGGLVEIGAHSVVHSDLTTLSPTRERLEIRESRAYLRELTGGALGSFSYPHGGHDADTVAVVRDAGFERACCSRRHVVRRRTDPYALPRVTVPDCDGDAFAALLWSYLGR